VVVVVVVVVDVVDVVEVVDVVDVVEVVDVDPPPEVEGANTDEDAASAATCAL
jgi:hypothetical protein